MKIEVGKYYRLFQTSPYSRTLIGKAVSVGVQTNYGLGSVFDIVEDGYKWKVWKMDINGKSQMSFFIK